MSQSLTQIYIHAVFGTKNREHLINELIEEEFHKYMTGIFKGLESPILRINSMPDHTHILFRMSKNKSIASIMETSKKESSKWFKTKGINNFKWQGGYGAFSVSSSKLDGVIRYIKNQKVHHEQQCFLKEIAELMALHKISDFSEEYFWV
jgi:REP element-mobilizing transposase RayT